MMKRLFIAASFATCLATGASAGVLDTVKQKGFLSCGSNTGLAGFGLPDD